MTLKITGFFSFGDALTISDRDQSHLGFQVKKKHIKPWNNRVYLFRICASVRYDGVFLVWFTLQQRKSSSDRLEWVTEQNPAESKKKSGSLKLREYIDAVFLRNIAVGNVCLMFEVKVSLLQHLYDKLVYENES